MTTPVPRRRAPSLRRWRVAVALACASPFSATAQSRAAPFSLEQLMSYPYPTELVASAGSSAIAWVFDQRGVRNVWVADGPTYSARQLTAYRADDGQELTNVSISRDGKTVVYVRGGDHDANWNEDIAPNPALAPVRQQVEVWTVPFAGGTPKLISAGDEPVISPRGDRVAFVHDGGIWTAPIDGSSPAKLLFFARGKSGSPVWSPDGARLAFVSDRGDHSFIGVWAGDSTPLRYLAPTTSRDFSPQWSPDGTRIAFVRIPGAGGAPPVPLALFEGPPLPWAIWSADVATGRARAVWQSPDTRLGSFPTTDGQANLHWASNGRIVFVSNLDGWPHLYSIAEQGGTPLLLTPGRFMVEFVRLSPDGASLVYGANTGSNDSDGDRRHVFRVPVDRAQPVALTPGDGLEWLPSITGDGTVAFIAAGARTPPLPAVLKSGSTPQMVGAAALPADFPTASLVVPRSVTFRAADGVVAHGQLFEPAGGASGTARAAIVYVHGGPPRQMLLGWHYWAYYANSYAMNQYLASRGYVVLSVNYRLGIGYGHDYNHPSRAGADGAAEYQDVKAGAEYLRRLPGVDPHRIGIYGGSYGGYLTALALARNSDLFVAGVDLHGVHDWTADLASEFAAAAARYEHDDVARARSVAWKASPVASIATWRSPVLLVHGDDDRNVAFAQTVDLARRLDAAHVPYEELVIPDEIHGFLRHATWLVVNRATADFFDRMLAKSTTSPSASRTQ
ncbi:MAG TPA: prolyl oligopeptidase family serine peptidase [Gemmatimonadaceae bacterium]